MSAGKAGLHAPSHCPCMSVSRHTHVRAADRGHRGSTCVYTKTKPVLKSPVQKTCLHVESGCILGSPFYFRKEIEVKGEKQLVSWCVCVCGGLRAEGGLGVTVHLRFMARAMHSSGGSGQKACTGSHDNTSPWVVHVQLCVSPPPHSGNELCGPASGINSKLKRLLLQKP